MDHTGKRFAGLDGEAQGRRPQGSLGACDGAAWGTGHPTQNPSWVPSAWRTPLLCVLRPPRCFLPPNTWFWLNPWVLISGPWKYWKVVSRAQRFNFWGTLGRCLMLPQGVRDTAVWKQGWWVLKGMRVCALRSGMKMGPGARQAHWEPRSHWYISGTSDLAGGYVLPPSPTEIHWRPSYARLTWVSPDIARQCFRVRTVSSGGRRPGFEYWFHHL